MGLIYSKINLYNESENCYEKALGLEPDNESYKKNLEVKTHKIEHRFFQKTFSYGTFRLSKKN